MAETCLWWSAFLFVRKKLLSGQMMAYLLCSMHCFATPFRSIPHKARKVLANRGAKIMSLQLFSALHLHTLTLYV